MQDVDRRVLLHLLRRLRGMDEVSRRATRGSIRKPSLNERTQGVHMPGHDIMFCVHGKHLFIPCVACRRSKRECDNKREKYLSQHV